MESRNFWFTHYKFLEKENWDNVYETGDHIKYLRCGKEKCPTTQREHIQGWLSFRSAKTKSAAYKYFNRIAPGLASDAMGPIAGSLQQNDNYCAKEGIYWDYGVRPHQGRRKDIEEVMTAIKTEGMTEAAIAEENPQLWAQYGRRFEDYRMLCAPKRMWKTHTTVIWGIPGSGKTHKAWERLPNAAPVTLIGPFLCGYHGEEEAIIDDFIPGNCSIEIVLKIMDKFPYTANVKGSSCNWVVRNLIITSNYNPEYWYPEHPTAIMRRIDDLVIMNEKYTE